MPEYLAPGVYVEEVPSGNKPIEGVSTSTAGMVGITQRGPVNEPTLVTSFADFNRTFGGYLDHRVFSDDGGGARDGLPYAAEGFFTNGGQRLYVSRIIGEDATFATVDLLGGPQTDAANTALTERVAAGDDTLLLDDGTNIGAGDRLLLMDGPRSEYVTVQSAPVETGVRLAGRLHRDHAAVPVAIQTVAEGANLTGRITGNMEAGGGLLLNNVADMTADEVLRIRDTADETRTEFVILAANASGTLREPGLLFDHPQATTQVHRVTLADDAGEPGGRTIDTGAAQDDIVVPLTNTTNLDADQVLRIGAAADREYQVVRAVVSSLSIATTPVAFIHAAATPVARQVPLLRVHARYPGEWGNALRISVRRASLLETAVAGNPAIGDSPITLDATFGLTTGSVLEMVSGGTATRQRVSSITTATNEVGLDGGLDVDLADGDVVESVEFDLIVERLENDKVVESEVFANLGLAPGHLRHAQTLVGRFNTAAGEPEAAGDSDLVRLSDLTGGDADLLLSLPEAAITRQLSGGDDDLATMDDDMYIGTPSVDPADRTGVFSLENIDDISIVAVPGRTSQDVQNALIAHCTLMRYRFAVLDAEDGARLRDVQAQRQRYDTTYGAIYYPWLVIGDRFGRNGDVHSIPPSGHVVGIYARSDVQRGVHKAPANEVVLGIRDLQVRLTKGEQDILNPKHINCLRDFRELNRGMRVWGARTLSSDPEWKYINVRRLFLFVEKSIERGSQYAVFEPNSEFLWATIRRSVTNFLTSVWRDGALEGTKVEEAFFVKVDRTTMTQNDIDNGRLIILVGIAPVKPAEFVIFRISQKTREATG